MSTIQVALRVFTVTGALLAAGATQASDVTADRHQASLQETSRGVEQGPSAKGQESSGPKANATRPCTCSRAGTMKGSLSADEEAELDRLRSQGG